MGAWGFYEDENDEVQDEWVDFVKYSKNHLTVKNLILFVKRLTNDHMKVGITISFLRQHYQKNPKLPNPKQFPNVPSVLERRIWMINSMFTSQANNTLDELYIPDDLFPDAFVIEMLEACYRMRVGTVYEEWSEPEARQKALDRQIYMFLEYLFRTQKEEKALQQKKMSHKSQKKNPQEIKMSKFKSSQKKIQHKKKSVSKKKI